MPTSSEVLQAILEYIYTDESPTIRGNPPGKSNKSWSALCYGAVLFLFDVFASESLNVEFVCNVLVVADQLLITRLKEMCEVVITENCKFIFHTVLPASLSWYTLISWSYDFEVRSTFGILEQL